MGELRWIKRLQGEPLGGPVRLICTHDPNLAIRSLPRLALNFKSVESRLEPSSNEVEPSSNEVGGGCDALIVILQRGHCGSSLVFHDRARLQCADDGIDGPTGRSDCRINGLVV